MVICFVWFRSISILFVSVETNCADASATPWHRLHRMRRTKRELDVDSKHRNGNGKEMKKVVTGCSLFTYQVIIFNTQPPPEWCTYHLAEAAQNHDDVREERVQSQSQQRRNAGVSFRDLHPDIFFSFKRNS